MKKVSGMYVDISCEFRDNRTNHFWFIVWFVLCHTHFRTYGLEGDVKNVFFKKFKMVKNPKWRTLWVLWQSCRVWSKECLYQVLCKFMDLRRRSYEFKSEKLFFFNYSAPIRPTGVKLLLQHLHTTSKQGAKFQVSTIYHLMGICKNISEEKEL